MKWLSLRKSHVIFLLSLVIFSPAFGVVVWNNGISPADAIDEDLTIDGNNIVLDPNGTCIQNTMSNTTLTVTVEGNSFVRGTNQDGEQSQLYICADTSTSVVRFVFDTTTASLAFQGSDNAEQATLLIVFGGQGTIEFDLGGGNTIAFNKESDTGPVNAYLMMNSSSGPLLHFLRADETADHAFVQIGEQSLLSYIAPTALDFGPDETGTIRFTPTNGDTGRTVLQIENKGAFLIYGRLTNQSDKKSITLADIDRTTAAGLLATAEVVSNDSSETSGLLVENENECCFELLWDPFCNLNAREGAGFKGSFNGIQYGYVLGANGKLDVQDDAYLDYVGLALNICPCVDMVPGFPDIHPEELLKARNYSALIVDGNHNPLATDAQICLGEKSAIFYRSGVDDEGDFNDDLDSECPFAVDYDKRTVGAGNIVFDVEGPLDVLGSNDGDMLESQLQVLSLCVEPTGGCLFLGDGTDIFPLRNFDKDMNGNFVVYNYGAFLINNCMNLFNTALSHTDQNHCIFQKNDVKSEPTYIGGEVQEIKEDAERPKIKFFNSRFLLHTSAAATGVDFFVPNEVSQGGDCEDNLSKFIFYTNGKQVDNGTGRSLILGTQPGSTACDGCSIISRDAHLDIFQDVDCPSDASDITHKLNLEVADNTSKIIENVPQDIAGQTSVHTIYLGFNSNISIGTDSTTCTAFDNPTFPKLMINGNFFSFETRGGSKGLPEFSNVTGEGGIFVDLNGTICIAPDFRMNLGAMVTRSCNGIIDLPKGQVYFDCFIGFAEWMLELNQTDSCVRLGQCISEYTLNWIATKKDFDCFCPYDVGSVNVCDWPVVEEKNVSCIPTFAGELGQLQIQGSRLGDPVHIKVDCGWVKELVFEKTGNYSAQAAIGIVVLQGNGRVGLNTAHRNPDSSFAQNVLGVNGITIIANGSGEVLLNEDMEVTSLCSILKGPDHTSGDLIRFTSVVPREIRIKKGGSLDLRSFASFDVVQFDGKIRIVLEPGARVLLDGAILRLADDAQIICEPSQKAEQLFQDIPLGAIDNDLDPCMPTPADQPHNEFAPLTNFGQGVGNTDSFRVRFIGTGIVNLRGQSEMFIPKNAFVGVETLFEIRGDNICEISETDLTFLENDAGRIVIGDDDSEGGSFQIGNTQDYDGHSINCKFILRAQSGTDLRAPILCIKEEGFLGFGVGIVDKRSNIPNQWYVDNLYNVESICVTLDQGQIKHDRIWDGDDGRASLWAISNDPNIEYTIDYQNPASNIDNRPDAFSNINGGGNLVEVSLATSVGDTGAIAPIVRDQDNNVIIDCDSGPENSPRLRVTVLSSSFLQLGEDVTGITGSELFDVLKTTDIFDISDTTRSNGLANYAQGDLSFRQVRTPDRAAWVWQDRIGRANVFDVITVQGLQGGRDGTTSDRREQAAQFGAVYATIDRDVEAPGDLVLASQIQ